MTEVCLMQILEWPDTALRQALPKAPARLLARLVRAYPRTAGEPFMVLLGECLSSPTLAFLKEEINFGSMPTYPEIRQAEAELLKLVREQAKVAAAAAHPIAA